MFCLCLDVAMEWSVFLVLIHCGHRAALSEDGIFWKCSCSAGEHQGFAVAARPACSSTKAS